jgi:signal transduction histidine kinase/ActR/RegA family two-component response regulator
MSLKIFKTPKSIRSKLLLITLSVTTLALLLFALAQIILGFYYAREELDKSLSTTAKTIGFQSTASLEFLDSYSATEILTALKQNKEIIKGCLYDQNKEIFASYVVGYEVCQEKLENVMITYPLFLLDTSQVVEPIVIDDRIFGYLHIESTLDNLFNYFKDFLLYVGLVFIVTLFLAYRFILYLQCFITEPVSNLLSVVKEVSESKNYDIRAQKLTNDEVGDLVSGFNNMLRIIQIHNENLEKEKKKAEFANNAKSEFLSNMSHEIRTPLNGVLGTADLLLRSDLSKDDEEAVKIIVESGKSLLAIINDVLDISKIEAGKVQLDLSSVDLKDVIESVVSTFTATASSKGIQLSASIPSDMPLQVQVDDMRLRQILTNLISNAVKFTSQGEISLKLEYEDVNGQHFFVFKVKDTGVGIEEDKLNMIFQRFKQEDGSITRVYGGTGLGLSICQELVELMNGYIYVDSKKGEGSVFSVKIPLEVTSKKKKNAQCHEHIQTKHKLKVLIAEDDLVNQKIVQKMVESLGHDASVVSNGLQAVEACKKDKFDVVLMDMQMPVLNGIDATKKIRQYEQENDQRKIPILALTANALAQHKKMCFEAGMTGYFTKPVTMNSIEEMLKIN